TALVQPKDEFVRVEMCPLDAPSQQAEPRPKDQRGGQLSCKPAARGPPCGPKRLVRNPDRFQPEVPADLQNQAQDGRVQVHVMVAVHVIQRKAGLLERVELRSELQRELPSDRRPEEKIDA